MIYSGLFIILKYRIALIYTMNLFICVNKEFVILLSYITRNDFHYYFNYDKHTVVRE